jgi:plasmid stabilization system protein ParE
MKLRVARSAVRDLDAIWAHIGAENSIDTCRAVGNFYHQQILVPCQESECRPEPA